MAYNDHTTLAIKFTGWIWKAILDGKMWIAPGLETPQPQYL